MHTDQRTGRLFLTAVVLSAVSTGLAHADTIDELVTNEAVFVLNLSGSETTQGAFEKTASFQAFHQTGLASVANRFLAGLPWDQIPESMDLGDSEPISLGDIGLAAAFIARFGGTLAISVPDGDEAVGPYGTLVVHKGRDFLDPLTDLFRELIEVENLTSDDKDKTWIETVESGQRTIYRIQQDTDGDFLTFAWWSEGEDLVLFVGLPEIEAVLEAAGKPEAQLVNSEVWKRVLPQPESEFAETNRVWVNTRKLLDHYGKLLPLPIEVTPSPIQLAAAEEDPTLAAEATVTDLIRRLGLQQVDSLTWQTGYQRKHLVTRTTVATNGPRTGLMKLYDHTLVSLNDLPPLPAGVTSFHIRSLDLHAAYGEVLSTIDRLVLMLPESNRAQWIKAKRATIESGVLDVRSKVFKPLGNVVCTFNDTRQELLGWGRSTVAVSVNDPKALEAGLDQWMDQVNNDAADIGEIVKHMRHGCPFYIGTSDSLPLTPGITICDGWMVIGWQPQTVETFILRSQGKLPVWDAGSLGDEARKRVFDRFTALSWSDPRGSLRLWMSVAPWAVDYLRHTVLQENGAGVEWSPKVSARDIPPVEVVLKPLFPNITITNVDAFRVQSTAWQSSRADNNVVWFVVGYFVLPMLSEMGFDLVDIAPMLAPSFSRRPAFSDAGWISSSVVNQDQPLRKRPGRIDKIETVSRSALLRQTP